MNALKGEIHHPDVGYQANMASAGFPITSGDPTTGNAYMPKQQQRMKLHEQPCKHYQMQKYFDKHLEASWTHSHRVA
tara:strand:- start:23207 stop:23437 length:231 start_codon:yes stop_codon:yes gene_type:complete